MVTGASYVEVGKLHLSHTIYSFYQVTFGLIVFGHLSRNIKLYLTAEGWRFQTEHHSRNQQPKRCYSLVRQLS